MELNKLALPDLTSLVDFMFIDSAKSLPMEARNSGIWRFMPIANNTGDSRRMSEIDLEEYASVKDESAQSSRARFQQGYTKDLEIYRVSKDVGISIEERNQNKYPQVIQKLTTLVSLPMKRMELDLQQRIANADQTSYVDQDGRTIDTTVGDGLAWASTAHTLKASSTTYRNILANNPQVSKGAIEAMQRLVKENTLNQFGQKMTMEYDILWTTDDEVDKNVVRELLTSTGSPEYTNPNVKNVYQGKFRHVVLSRVAVDASGAVDTTKRHYWGMASSTGTTAYLGVWEEPHTLPFRDANDGTDDLVTGVRAGYGICAVSGRGFAFSAGNGAA